MQGEVVICRHPSYGEQVQVDARIDWWGVTITPPNTTGNPFSEAVEKEAMAGSVSGNH